MAEMPAKLPPHQYALLKALAGDPGELRRSSTINDIAKRGGLDQSLVMAAATELQEQGFLTILESNQVNWQLGEEGKQILDGEKKLPEREVLAAIHRRGGTATLKELASDQELQENQIQAGKYAKSLEEIGWAKFDKGTLKLTPMRDRLDEYPYPNSPEERMIERLREPSQHTRTDDRPFTDERENQYRRLKNRKELVKVTDRISRSIELTEEGKELIGAFRRGEVTELAEVNELTPEMLADGSWREVRFRPYDVTLAAEQAFPGKAHPLMRIVEQTRLAFLEMGFSETTCPMAVSAFWDFDALFQPQDHPAREMQDTFYCKTPAAYALPDAELVERVRRAHEDGGGTGSTGWGYKWSAERAAQVVLRTHMTAASIEAIARNPQAPQKIFSIGRVFRRETVDATHLPEFIQVDGIIIDEHATLATLLGTLAKFYERMGIPEVKMRPSFFPYTEPSVEVQIKWGGEWMEMGGGGIFRPEVTLPFGCTAPVLAWGLGMERLAMARYGVKSIKDLYQSDLDWLKSVPLEG
ncbi:phenylalanine--tRNA ligase subunit alpha [bacterium]|nr:phenylalanine--tRNA ligase subunit alpha [bacterium]